MQGKAAYYPRKRSAWKLAHGQAQSADIKVVIGLKQLPQQIRTGTETKVLQIWAMLTLQPST